MGILPELFSHSLEDETSIADVLLTVPRVGMLSAAEEALLLRLDGKAIKMPGTHAWATVQAVLPVAAAQVIAEWQATHLAPFDRAEVETTCLPGEQRVSAFGGHLAVSARWYEGDMVVIRTAGGAHLSCTPNHPVLTDHGWVPAGCLHEGDQVVKSVAREWAGEGDTHDEHMPPTIEQVAETARILDSSGGRHVPISAKDFHGDGSDGEVARVWANGLLRDRLEATLTQSGHNLLLQGRRVRMPFPRLSRTRQLFGGSRTMHESTHSARPLVGGHVVPLSAADLAPRWSSNRRTMGGQHFDPALRRSEARPSLAHGGGNALAHLWRVDSSSRNASPVEEGHDARSPYAKPSLEDLNRNAGPVCLDQVVNVRREHFHGHVYNLQTASGFYTAGGIVVHNCHVTVRYGLVPDIGREAVAALLRDSPPLRLLISGLGVFEGVEDGTQDVLVAWVTSENHVLEALHARLGALPHAPEEYPFTPHLTLARVPLGTGEGLLDRLTESPHISVTIDRLEWREGDGPAAPIPIAVDISDIVTPPTPTKHYGPGDHPSGSPQDVHGGGGGATAEAHTGEARDALADLVGRIDAPDGGFSVHPMTHASPTSGYMVSIYPTRSKHLPVAQVRAATLMRFLVDNRDLFQQPEHYFGAWHDPATHEVWLDISVHTTDRAAAERLAQQHEQIAYFDLGAGASVPTPPRTTHAETKDSPDAWRWIPAADGGASRGDAGSDHGAPAHRRGPGGGGEDSRGGRPQRGLKHYGPGEHPSGSSQEAHGGGGETGGDASPARDRYIRFQPRGLAVTGHTSEGSETPLPNGYVYVYREHSDEPLSDEGPFEGWAMEDETELLREWEVVTMEGTGEYNPGDVEGVAVRPGRELRRESVAAWLARVAPEHPYHSEMIADWLARARRLGKRRRKHYGPGEHPSGSSQEVHGGEGGGGGHGSGQMTFENAAGPWVVDHDAAITQTLTAGGYTRGTLDSVPEMEGSPLKAPTLGSVHVAQVQAWTKGLAKLTGGPLDGLRTAVVAPTPIVVADVQGDSEGASGITSIGGGKPPVTIINATHAVKVREWLQHTEPSDLDGYATARAKEVVKAKGLEAGVDTYWQLVALHEAGHLANAASGGALTGTFEALLYQHFEGDGPKAQAWVGRHVSGYAGEAPEEAMAETFARYMWTRKVPMLFKEWAAVFFEGKDPARLQRQLESKAAGQGGWWDRPAPDVWRRPGPTGLPPWPPSVPPTKHYGPGEHPSGSPQAVHGGDWSEEGASPGGEEWARGGTATAERPAEGGGRPEIAPAAFADLPAPVVRQLQVTEPQSTALDHEELTVITPTGNTIVHAIGGTGSVTIGAREIDRIRQWVGIGQARRGTSGLVATHNHPAIENDGRRVPGADDMPPSFADLVSTINVGYGEQRAVTERATYRLRPGTTGWPSPAEMGALADEFFGLRGEAGLKDMPALFRHGHAGEAIHQIWTTMAAKHADVLRYDRVPHAVPATPVQRAWVTVRAAGEPGSPHIDDRFLAAFVQLYETCATMQDQGVPRAEIERHWREGLVRLRDQAGV